MYAYIKGEITEIEPSHIVIENNGVGFLIIVPNPFSYKLSENMTVYTHHYVKEDINNLYGFINKETKTLFLKLISVSGIGPKTGLSILASNDTAGIIRAIENSDVKYLTKFPGIGNKTAQQIILDLKGKITLEDKQIFNDNMNDAELALISLGYSKVTINKVLKTIDDNLSVEEIIKAALIKILN